MDFTYFYKTKYSLPSALKSHKEYDVFLSCYSSSERSQAILNNINSKTSLLFLLPEYHDLEVKDKAINCFKINLIEEEAVIFKDLFSHSTLTKGTKLCIDLTGFFIPHLLFLINYLHMNGFKSFDAIYSEPNTYNNKERTLFSSSFHTARQIQGYEGCHVPDTSNDILIIGSGYDNARIIDVANNKAKARKIQVFGFPSLQPDMYQENVLQAYKAESALGGDSFIDLANNIYAPANDPFVAAQLIMEFINKENAKRSITNLYFSPISTKAHALGFALYYFWQKKTPASIIFPFCHEHYTDNTRGIGKIFIYTVEMP
jgi:hypothetical protein